MFRKKRACGGMPNFHGCRGFSENVAHVCAYLLCANGKASLRGMLQAAFLKANRNSWWCGSHQLSPKIMKKPRLGLDAKEKCPKLLFTAHGTGRAGIRAEDPSKRPSTAAIRVLSPFCVYREPALVLLAVISLLPFPAHTHACSLFS